MHPENLHLSTTSNQTVKPLQMKTYGVFWIFEKLFFMKRGDCLSILTFCDRMFVCLKGLCDFEQHSCGWKNVSEESYWWTREMANITSVPGVDHTTGKASGKYSHLLLCSVLVITVVCFLLIPHHYVYISALTVFLLCNTYVFDAGHVMHAKAEPSLTSLAILEYSVDKRAAVGCQIRYSDRVLPPS